MTDRAALAELATKWIALWSDPVDWSLFDVLHADGFEDASSAGRPSTKEGFARGLQDLTRAFPDLRCRVEDLVIDSEEDRIAIRWSAAGINKERYLGIGPTGKLTRITGIEIIELHEGRIVRRWGEWDISDHRPADRSS